MDAYIVPHKAVATVVAYVADVTDGLHSPLPPPLFAGIRRHGGREIRRIGDTHERIGCCSFRGGKWR